MNDSSTIYISHSEDLSNHHDASSMDSTSATTLSKKVAQNRAAQKAFRQRKAFYVEDLENKARQLDECKKAMIQLQADNDYLRKTVTRLKDQLNQQVIAGSIIPTTTSTPSSLLPSSSSPSSSLSSPSPQAIANPLNTTSLSPPLQPSCPPASSLTASSPPSESPSLSSSTTPDLSSTPFPMLHDAKRKTTLSKREKKRQRLLADEKLYQNDDLEPIQLHCPLAMNTTIPPPSVIKSEESSLLDSSSLMAASGLIQPFFDLPITTPLDPHDQYINFIEDDDDDDDDDLPSSSSSSCSFSYPPTSLF